MQRHVAGGRDFDRILFNDFVVPWLEDNYSLPDDWLSRDEYKKLCSVATFLAEQAKIELSSSDAVTIQGDGNVHLEDEDGGRFKSGGTMGVTRNVFANSALSPRRNFCDRNFTARQKSGGFFLDASRKLSAMSARGSIEVNPMTAVSEGAAIFAEAVDWDSDEHERKGTHEQIQSDGELGLSFRYESRTPDKKARIAVVLKREVDGYTLKISSLDTGWDSGLVTLRNKEIVTVPLHKRGGHFKSGRTVGVTRNVFANVGVVTSTKLDDKNLTARHKSGGSFIWTRHEDFSQLLNAAITLERCQRCGAKLFPRF